jgi:hypothetical protein
MGNRASKPTIKVFIEDEDTKTRRSLPERASLHGTRGSLYTEIVRFILFPLAVLSVATPLLLGSSPQAWEMSTYKDFSAGRMKGISLGRDGRLELAPKLTRIYTTDQPVVWATTRTPDGATWLGTGHGGRLYRVDASGNGTLIFTAPEPEIFALAADTQGRVYAATSPNGKIYRIENGRATEYFNPGTTYILSLAIDGNGVLYAGTGSEGKVFRITGANQAGVWYETGQGHVTSLAVDAQGRLLAGTDPNGIVYRITGQGQAFTLYDADLPEIRALHLAADGSIYAAAMGGSLAKQTTFAAPAAGASAPSTSSSTSITVTAAEGAEGINPTKPEAAAQQPNTPAAVTAATPVIEYPGVEKAALYRIGADNTVEKLWSSTEENLYDIAPSGTSIYLATDNQGRVYEFTPDRKLRLIVETREAEALHLAANGQSVSVATGHVGALYRIDSAPETTGEFESPVHDGTAISRWGKLSWHSEPCGACRVAMQTRTGNTIRPDATWSNWSTVGVDPAGGAINSPNARYIQWKAEFAGANGRTPTLDYVRLTSLPQNAAPKVSSITVSSSQVTAGAAATTTPSAAATFTLTVTDTGETGPSSLTGTPTQAVTRAGSENLVITWTAEDPEADKLTYTLEFRADDQRDWKALKRDLTEATFTLPADAWADGRYFLRVIASDAAVNTPTDGRSGELTSPPIVVDRTPPVVRLAANQATASDMTSPLTRCEFSIDAGPWALLASTDGIIDSKEETLALPAATGTGERLLAVRCYDAANNAGTARLVLR